MLASDALTLLPTPLAESCCISAVVAIPVCNERRHIEACLASLDHQTGVSQGSYGVLLLLNNCSDDTQELVEAVRANLSFLMRIVVRDSVNASAGWARRLAMEAAAGWLDEVVSDGVLLTTDADSRVPVDWIARNLANIAAGADAVAGRLILDPIDSALLPPALHARGRLEGEYEALLVEITTRMNGAPGNPWPTHWCRSGASLASRLSTYREVGGMPDIPCGEDRAFVEAVLIRDRIVRFDPELLVVTSGRLLGRAKGGVADTIRLRCDAPESLCDDRLERLGRVVLRAVLGHSLRRLHASSRRTWIRRAAKGLSIDNEAAVEMAALPTFGLINAAFEANSKRLCYQPLRPAELPKQIRRAKLVVAFLRMAGRYRKQVTSPEVQDVTLGKTAVEAFD